MTRQEKLQAIGQRDPSRFEDTLNQMSYFIIPVPHTVFTSKKSKDFLDRLKALGWTCANEEYSKEERLFNSNDGREMTSIKPHVYNEILPELNTDKAKNVRDFFLDFKNLMFQKKVEKSWTFKQYYKDVDKPFVVNFEIDGIDLWIMHEHIAFYVIRTKIANNDTSNVTDISSRFNRSMRDFHHLYIDSEKKIFKPLVNEKFKTESDPDEKFKTESDSKVLDWLFELTTDDKGNLLYGSESKPNAKELLETDEYYPIFHTSSYAKMITAMHVDMDDSELEKIESDWTDDIVSSRISGTSALEEASYLLASTSEFYPTKMWENNEEYINSQIDSSEINIWKYWSGVALHDSLAFFSLGAGGSGIVRQARHSYYFIYILNLYVNYRLRYFEYKLIDKDFTSIEKIRPLSTEMQILRNQIITSEIASRFQPNVVHRAVINGMRTDEIFNEIKENMEATLTLTERNTGVVITLVLYLFYVAGLWIDQDMITNFIADHPVSAFIAGFIIMLALILIVSKFPQMIRKVKSWWKEGKRFTRGLLG